MDKSAQEEGQATAIQQIEKRKARRRLVQSTLLPHKSAPIESKSDQKNDVECNGEGKNSDALESCETQGRKKIPRSQKENSQIEATEKAKEKSSPEDTPEKDATPKKSARGARKKNAIPRKNSLPRKNVTPKKNGIIIGKTDVHSGEIGDGLPQIPNLRLEAKMMAEENSRVFGGKHIHPFFLSRNLDNRCQERIVQSKLKSNIIGPIHVFEKEQDGAVSLEWRNWKFSEKSFTNTTGTLDGPFSSIFESTVKSLCFDKFPSVSHPCSLRHPDNLSVNEASAPAISPYVVMECSQLFKDSDIVNEISSISDCVSKLEEQQSKLFQERVISSHLACANQLDGRLWTDKYQPQKAMEICGNSDSVKFLGEWLHTWCQRDQQVSKDCSGADECETEDPDYNSTQNDSDSETGSEQGSTNNVLLITGPVGSGKTASIYACAKEQGFRVLEANASECRNGIAVKGRFGALHSQSTLDSQLLQWSQESSIEFQGGDDVISPVVIHDHRVPEEPGNQVIEVIPISDEGILHEATEMSEKFADKDNSVTHGLGQLKPLILFEDVDIVFAEDRGFVSAVQQVADKVKAPVILTSNSEKPVLPDNLDRLELCFKVPLKKELLQHLSMVCSAEKVNIQSGVVEEFIEFCRRDIRKTIMHLQFWCLGERIKKGRDSEVHRLSSHTPFDLEAVYQILPKMIPWDFSSQLSEFVEKEITMSISTIEVIEDKFDDKVMQNDSYEMNRIEAKKKVMLGNNCSDHEYMDFIDFFNSSGNSLPFSQRNSKRKLVVMSSDSEDELLNPRVPTTPDKDACNELCIEVNGQCSSHCPSINKSLSPSTDLKLCSGAEKFEENLYQCSETLNMLNVTDTCISVDISHVPESSFVPETEIYGSRILLGGMSCDQLGKGALIEEASVSNEFRQHVLAIEADKFNESMLKVQKDSGLSEGACNVVEISSQEEVDDSQYELVESITKESQLMDECSCIDFNKNIKAHERCRPFTVIDAVRQSWRKLRNRCADLRHFVAAEHKYSSGIIEIACRMSDLISEAELLHTKCQSLNSFGFPMVFSEESEAFSWCNEQLQMTSSILEHGFCFYSKDIAAIGMDMGSDSRMDFSRQMPSTSSKMEVGAILGDNVHRESLDIGLGGDTSVLENAILQSSEKKLHLVNIIQSMVPSRAYMAIKDVALCEYLSSLGHMSRSESCRLSEGVNNSKRRRGRAAQNYLSTGSLMLSPEEISLLGQSCIYGKTSSQSVDANLELHDLLIKGSNSTH